MGLSRCRNHLLTWLGLLSSTYSILYTILAIAYLSEPIDYGTFYTFITYLTWSSLLLFCLIAGIWLSELSRLCEFPESDAGCFCYDA